MAYDFRARLQKFHISKWHQCKNLQKKLECPQKTSPWATGVLWLSTDGWWTDFYARYSYPNSLYRFLISKPSEIRFSGIPDFEAEPSFALTDVMSLKGGQLGCSSGQRHLGAAILVTVTLYAASACLKGNGFYVSLSEHRKHDREMVLRSSI